MRQQHEFKKNNQKGFTLLEILVVVAIMGFIAAMVVPRFADIVGGTEEVVCDSNQQRLVQAVSTYYETKGRFPGGLVNLVDEDGAQTEFDVDRYLHPTSTDNLEFADRGTATFDDEFTEHNYFVMHFLSEDEADELRSLGVSSVYNLNAYDYDGLDGVDYETEAGESYTAVTDEANQLSALRQAAVQEGLGVLMVGLDVVAGELGGTTIPAAAADEATDHDEFENYNNIGRIVMGVGPESALITEGLITAAGLCPEGINRDDVTWNNYSITLPRLEATMARLGDDERAVLANVSARGDEGEGIIRNNIDLSTTNSWDFNTQCPEGHIWPETEGLDDWVFNFQPDADEDSNWQEE